MRSSFTKTETLRRLRVAAQLVRESDRNIAKNFRVELGTRAIPVHAPVAALAHDIPKGDDLDDIHSLVGAAALEQVQQQGYVAHLYFSSTGDWGELYDVRTVWLGTWEKQPELVGRLS